MTCKRHGWDLQAHAAKLEFQGDLPLDLPLGTLAFEHGFLHFAYTQSALLSQISASDASTARLEDPDWDTLRVLARKFQPLAGTPLSLSREDRILLLLLESVQAQQSKFSDVSKQELCRLLRQRVRTEPLVGEAARQTDYARLRFLSCVLEELLDDLHSV
jgi:hypothetical protein